MLIMTSGSRSLSVSLSNMSSARRLEGGDWLVVSCNGDEHRVSKIDWEIAVEGTPVSTFPSRSGTYLISPADRLENGRDYWKENVIGWAIFADTILRPVVLNPESLIVQPWQVLHPDGSVERSDGSRWDSVGEWLAEVRRIEEQNN